MSIDASLYKKWLYKRNKGINPKDVAPKSKKQYWYQCTNVLCKKIFQTEPARKCPCCFGKFLCEDEDCVICFNKSVASHEKAIYWSPKNKLTPREVNKNTAFKYWFDCECGHEFHKIVKNITAKGGWCIYCAKKGLCEDEDCERCYEHSLASNDKAEFWSEKNDRTPRDVFKGSIEKYLFDCDCGHEFLMSPESINKGYWCQYCCNKSVKLCDDEECERCYERSFASHEVASYWSKRNERTARQTFKVSDKPCYLDCICGHEIQTSPFAVKYSDSWCPYCPSIPKELCEDDDCEFCYDKSFASCDKSEYWSSYNDKTPRQVPKTKRVKAWFVCENNHEIEKNVSAVTNGSWCQECKLEKTKKEVIKKEKEKVVVQKEKKACNVSIGNTFASHQSVKYWLYEKNEDLKPEDVTLKSHKEIWFKCGDCDHDFNALAYNISRGGWCPYCAKPGKKLCDDKDCDMCFQKSFASYSKAKFWSERNKKTPRQVFKSTSSDSYWFDCPKCNHDFIATTAHISKGGWCPYCAGQKMCFSKDCDMCFRMSFASHKRAKYWSDINEISPRKVFKCTSDKYYIDCMECGHVLHMQLAAISNGQNCAYCSRGGLCEDDDCDHCFQKSFASLEKSRFWSKKNKETARMVRRHSNQIFSFDCSCGHRFESRLSDITRGNWCPYCSPNPKQLCEDKN